ncbi:hypothetical protein [Kyrpidia tusciae]|uniref:Uncharacterized protein n=1 Tax=Kyrpidia tusciae (strain DSM 2912 / NBRC 15312 / T2) TaxID=562970 RepID=D5WXW3_KYRT2|nr:hypothetical protein [Kyrpidia tusciae]ADG06022.1 hypothetical protein Btus_1299 [Kyrpidia tusciae DSM 2912]
MRQTIRQKSLPLNREKWRRIVEVAEAYSRQKDAQASRDHSAVWKLSVSGGGRRTSGWYCFGRDSRCSAPGPRQSVLRGAASLSESVNCFAVKFVNI